MPRITAADVRVPADVPDEMARHYVRNYLRATRETGRLMLFAADQKMEHLNSDFVGPGIAEEDGDPEHLFRIGEQGCVGVLASQRGLIARYARDYPDTAYLVKMNSWSHLVGPPQDDPYSTPLHDFDHVLTLAENGVDIVGVGYTILLGSEYESAMVTEAGEVCAKAHAAGMLATIWLYPRGKVITDPKDAHLVAGAAGLAAALGADFAKVDPPQATADATSAQLLREAVRAAGRCGVICAGGGRTDVATFLGDLAQQLAVGGTVGNATGRNIHQRPLDEAVRLCHAIGALTYDDAALEDAMAIYEGSREWACPAVG